MCDGERVPAKRLKFPFGGDVQAHLVRYGLAMLGPVGSAATQFAVSILALHSLSTANFGTFAFLLTLIQFFTGTSNALICAPLASIVNRRDFGGSGPLRRGTFTVNLAYCLAVAAVVYGVGMASGLTSQGGLVFAAYAGAAMLRWFARAYSFARGTASRTILSDAVYNVSLGVCVAILWIAPGKRVVEEPAAILLFSACCGMIPFGFAHWIEQIKAWRLTDIRHFRPVWLDQARWSLLGGVTMEATANAHVYIVTAVAGPAAFAPLAAVTLLLRPIGVLMNALGDYERPRLARIVASGSGNAALQHSVRIMSWVLAAGWLATVLACTMVLAFVPRLVFPPAYSLHDMTLGVALWMGVTALRCARGPVSTLLQAGGGFRVLARASLMSAWVSIVGVAVTLWLAGPFGSLVGIAIGEAVFAILLFRGVGEWYAERAAGSQTAA